MCSFFFGDSPYIKVLAVYDYDSKYFSFMVRKPVRVSYRFDTNQLAQLQKMARGLKISNLGILPV